MAILSIIVPVYNEIKTIKEIVEKLKALAIDKEILIVNDGSTDGTERVLQRISGTEIKIIHHSVNRGKGVAVRTGIMQAKGDFIIAQDADLEYDPRDYLTLLDAITVERADLVLGVRFTNQYHGLFIPMLGNRILTALVNLLFGSKLNDVMTCYKLIRRSTFDALGLVSRGFDIEVEFIAKALKNKLVIKEVPVSYAPRNYSQGKKIRIYDGLVAIVSILKHRFAR